jgi:2-hydroxycyclohexanecarboxyl-CoA dehydrogenase
VSSSPEHAGRVAVVTGGNSGIGRGIADRLHREGARVTILDVASEAVPHGARRASPIAHHRADVAHERDVDDAFSAVNAREGRVDYLVCCASIFPRTPFLDVSLDEWKRTIDINLTGSFLCCRAAVRIMKRQRFGRIVLFSSSLARTAAPRAAAYVASKAGVLGLANSLALEVATEQIRVNVVSPGITDTPQPRGHLTQEDLYARAATIPLGRIGTVSDMVDACLFLLGDGAASLIGQDLRVNGGAPLW